MRFQWDPAKGRANHQKHGIAFADAVGVFEDPDALTIEDPDALREQRFITLGLDLTARLLVVVYTHRGDCLRLISARRATKQEEKTYATGI